MVDENTFKKIRRSSGPDKPRISVIMASWPLATHDILYVHECVCGGGGGGMGEGGGGICVGR